MASLDSAGLRSEHLNGLSVDLLLVSVSLLFVCFVSFMCAVLWSKAPRAAEHTAHMKLTKQTNRREPETSRRSTERPSKCSLRRPALSRLAITYSYFGRARELLEQARAMAEALGDTDGVGRACNKTQRKGK